MGPFSDMTSVGSGRDITSLVEAVRRDPSDELSVTALVRVARPFAVNVAMPLIDVGTVDDVVQDAVIEMLANLRMLRDAGAFRAWFRLIVRKHADRHRRAQRPLVQVDDDRASDHPSADDIVAQGELIAAVREALSHIRDRDRVLLDLKYVAEWNDDRLAQLLGISRGAVRKRLFDARRRLRPGLAERLDIELPQRLQETTRMPFDQLFGSVSSADDVAKLLPVTTPNPARPKALAPLYTGFPVIDLLVPLPRGGLAAWRTGSLYLINELIGNLAAGGPAVLVAVGAHRPLPNGIYHRFHRLVAPTDTASLIIVIDVQDGRDIEAVRIGGGLAAALADESNDVVLALDAVISSEVDPRELRGFAGLRGEGSVTVLTVTQPAIGVITDVDRSDDNDGLDVSGFDAVIAFTTAELVRGMSPPVDTDHSWSKVVGSHAIPQRHAEAAAAARELLEKSAQLRAALSQPFDHGADWAGHSGRHVPIDEALDAVAPVLAP